MNECPFSLRGKKGTYSPESVRPGFKRVEEPSVVRDDEEDNIRINLID